VADPAGGSVDERVAANQARFRRANDDLHARYIELLATGAVPFICECSDERCTHVVSLTLEEYGEIREHDRRFFVVPGHRLSAGERVVEEAERYLVTEKPPAADETASRPAA
jgi:hypothetical protein